MENKNRKKSNIFCHHVFWFLYFVYNWFHKYTKKLFLVGKTKVAFYNQNLGNFENYVKELL